MDLESAGTGLIGALLGGLAAFFGLRERVSVQDQKIADFIKNIDASVKRIESAHEKHSELVVYRDKCDTCGELRDAKFAEIKGMLAMVIESIQHRRKEFEP